MMKDFLNSRRVHKLAFYAVLMILLIVACFLIYNLMIMSFKSNSEIYNIVPTMWPRNFTWENYIKLFTQTDFVSFVKNTLIVALVVSILSILVSILAGYGIARFDFRGKKAISRSVLYAYLMPRSAMYIPLYMLVTFVGLANTREGLILVYGSFWPCVIPPV